MAIGDAAAAAGLVVFAATQDKRLGYQNDNQRGDDIAAVITSVASKADASATTAALAGKAATVHTHVQSDVSGLVTALAGKATTAAVASAQTDATKARTGDMGIDIWVRDVGGMTRQAVWMGNNGLVLLGYASSVRAKKQNIRRAADATGAAIAESWELTREMARQAVVCLFRYRWAVAAERQGRERAHIEIGVIADDLHAAGLWPFVVYEDGKPKGVHYDLLGLLALQLAQWDAEDLDAERAARIELEDRVSELAATVAKLEAHHA